MTVEVQAVGVTCNLGCTYCYQNTMRDTGESYVKDYDLGKIKAQLEHFNSNFTLYGGEALLMPIEDIEELWKFGYEKFGTNSIQSNVVLWTQDHNDLAVKYNAGVGISVDGPGELNHLRWSGTKEKTDKNTQKTQDNIRKLCEAGVNVSLIATLHTVNATKEKIPAMKEWFKELEAMGVMASRLHLLEVDNDLVKEKYVLSTEEIIYAMNEFSDFADEELTSMTFDVFDDMNKLLRGDDNVTCVWVNCDPYTTSAVQGIGGDGAMHNCGRADKDGVMWLKADQESWERYVTLPLIPQEYGGCKDCRFWLMCRSQCPGTSIDGDWRNKTEHCEVWMSLFDSLETKMVANGETPLSLAPELPELEKRFAVMWQNGGRPTMAPLLDDIRNDRPLLNGAITADMTHGDSHGDSNNNPDQHGDKPHGDHTNVGPDTRHGDGHGDSHGDSEATSPHGDHTNAPEKVTDQHGDLPHGDSHGDN